MKENHLKRNKVKDMSLTEFIQSLLLSGALGFVGLNWLQNKGIITSYLSKEDANYLRIIFGVIDYVAYLALSFSLVYLVKNTELATILAILGTVIIAVVYTCLYGWWGRKHMQNQQGFSRLTVREAAFTNPDRGDIQADLFRMDNTYMGSGLLHDANVEAGVPGDVSMYPLSEGYVANTDISQASKNSTVCYVDVESGIRYYLTYFSLAES